MILPRIPLVLLAPLVLASSDRAGYGSLSRSQVASTSELLDLRGVGSSNAQSVLNTSFVSTINSSSFNKLAGNESSSWMFAQAPPSRRPGSTPGGCPPCFNCLLPAFSCGNAGECSQYDGQCRCSPGFGGQDCLTPRMSLLLCPS